MARKVEVVALLVDVVSSRASDRKALHSALHDALTHTNQAVPALDPLRMTVGDELQAIYPTLGQALEASFIFRLLLAPTWEVRFGLGGGEVEDIGQGIQDGSGWWLAREAITEVRHLADKPGHASARTGIRDSRPQSTPGVEALCQLVDAHLARLRPSTLLTLRGLRAGLDNAAIAQQAGISPSANSQRVINSDLRPLAAAMTALSSLP